MNYYQEITLLQDSDISLGFLWQKVYQQVHIALVDNKTSENLSEIAVGFPEYSARGFPLGKKLRLFADSQEKLNSLAIGKWLNKLSDYTHVKSVQVVPEVSEYVCFSRKHVKTAHRIEQDMHQKARLWASKSGIGIDEALEQLEKSKPTASSSLPFVYMYSQETKKRDNTSNGKFPIFIEQITKISKSDGVFDCYGLSAKRNPKGTYATVPMF